MKNRPLRRKVYLVLVNRLGKMVRNRENSRFMRTRGFALARKMFLAIGRKFSAEGALDHFRDILYLRKEEIFDYIKCTTVTADLRTLVEIRRKESQEWKEKSPPGHFVTLGLAHRSSIFLPPQAPEDVASIADISGTACSPGKIIGRARVVHEPYELDNMMGDIMVVLHTDPGWVTLFPTASRILQQKGSLFPIY